MRARQIARGFNLIEVMAAMAVLGVGLVVSAPLVHYSVDRATEGRRVTSAQLLATHILERLRFEVRYDAQPPGGSPAAAGFTLADAWKADILPYSSSDLVTGPSGELQNCQPQGAQDVQAWNVGPLRFRFENFEYYVCYVLQPSARPDVPPESVEATVKVIWRAGDTYRAHRLNGILMNGR